MTGGTLVCGQRLDGCRRQGDPVITRAVFIDLKIATLCQKLRLESAPQSPSLPGGSERLPPFCRPFCRPGPAPAAVPPAAGAIALQGPLLASPLLASPLLARASNRNHRPWIV